MLPFGKEKKGVPLKVCSIGEKRNYNLFHPVNLISLSSSSSSSLAASEGDAASSPQPEPRIRLCATAGVHGHQFVAIACTNGQLICR